MYSYEEDYDPQGSHARETSEPRRAAWQWALLALIFFGSLSSYAYLDTAYVDEAVIEPAPAKTARTAPIKVRPAPPAAKPIRPGSDFVVEYESEIGREASRSDTVISEATVQKAPTARTTRPKIETVTPRTTVPSVQPPLPNAPVRPNVNAAPPAVTRRAIEPINPPKTSVDIGPTELPPLQDALDFSMTPRVAPPPLISPPLPVPDIPLHLQITPPPATTPAPPTETPPMVAFRREMPQTVTVELVPSEPPLTASIAPRTQQQALDPSLSDTVLSQSTPPSIVADAGQTPAADIVSEQALAQAPQALAALPKTAAPIAAAPVVLNPMVASRAIVPPVPAAPEPFSPKFDFDGRFVVQVASFASVVSACAVWDDLRAEYPNLFDKAETIVRPTTLASGKAVYRLRVGAFAKRRHADAWCKAFKSEGGECFVTKR